MLSEVSAADDLIYEGMSAERMCERDLCDREATCLVWCDHHRKGCDYTGFRCDVHFNLLYLDTVRQMDAISKGWLSLCKKCGGIIPLGVLSDHLRWARL